MKALIKVGYGCNQLCTFCHTLEERHLDGESAEVERKIHRAKALGHDMVVLSGGEATVRPELFRWAALVASLDMDFGLVTNGLLLAYPEVVDRLIALRLKYVYLSLHGPQAVHEEIVRTQSFPQAMAALHNLSGKGLDLTINAVVVRQNVSQLKALVDVCLPFTDAVLKFSMVQPKGGGDLLFERLMPRVEEVGAHVREAIAYGRERAGKGELRFAHDGIPFCHLAGCEDLYDDLKTHRFATMVEIGEPDFFPVDDLAKVQPEVCTGCALRGPCPGLYAGYRDAFGDGELRPVRSRPRSNSFNYVFEALVPTKEGACPLREDGVSPWDRARTLFLRHQGRIARYRTATRDFSDQELLQVKQRQGQVYVDVSKKAAPDDFAQDLVQVRRSPLCEGCPERPRCTGLYEPLLEDVFERDDRRVRELLGALEGDVLDVGCGDGPYDDLLGPRASAGAMRYVGLEPAADLLERARRRRPWAVLRQGTAESLAETGAYDHVLVLRSWNHLADPAEAASRFFCSLRPGGHLTVVDNEAFGLARGPAQAQKGERSAAAFEHWRNDGAAEARKVLDPLGFELLEVREVSASTSNQWLLRYRRPAGPDS